MGSVLVAYEKHGDFFYPAATDEELGKSAFAILKDRFDQGYWYHSPDELFPDDSQWQVSLKQLIPVWDDDADVDEKKALIAVYRETVIKQIPDDDAQKVVETKLKSAIRNYKDKKAYKEWYDEMVALLESGDWAQIVTYKSGRTEPLSWKLLNDRSGEYERVELEPLQEVEL